MTAAVDLPDADPSTVRALVRALIGKKHRRGVMAVAANPVWRGDHEFAVDGHTVRVRTAPSVLAIRDAITQRHDVDWVVVLTDRPADELPAGVLEHLVPQGLRNLDPFPLLLSVFASAQQEFDLLGLNSNAARAALRELGDKVAPAPGGVLTEDHLFAELARTKFGLEPTEWTPHQVAHWSMRPNAVVRQEAWRQSADAALFERFLGWLSRRLGVLGPVFTTVWRTVGPQHVVPLGLVAALLSDTSSAAAFPAPADVVTRVRTRLELELGDTTIPEQRLAAWADTATLTVGTTPDATSALTVAETWVTRLQATPLVARSDVLSTALPPRISAFAAALSTAIDSPADQRASNAWADVIAHRDAHVDSQDAPRDVRVAAAALRLLRRLQAPWPHPATLSEWLDAYRNDLSWVDSAVNSAFIGADDPQLAAATHRLVTAVRDSRATLDREFARALAASGVHRESSSGAPLYVEDVLSRVVKPLTKPQRLANSGVTQSPTASPVLVIVADGMGAVNSNEIVADILRRQRPQWQDCILTDTPTSALAALPTVTKFSRCSLLTGALATGTQDAERTGFSNWLQHNGLPASGQALFHKTDLDALSRGHALAADVRAALEDTRGRPVVACVLNDIDDALDRSDPIGTSWSIKSLKHLDALLTAAATVGRSVVLVSDHGHVVERREQPSVQRGEQVSARYRLAAGIDTADTHSDEVFVEGPRVLTADHRAVLAIDEQLRYRRLKAGYHGGAALAEAVVPVTILINGAIPQHLGLEAALPAAPRWWGETSEPAQPIPAPDPQPTRKPAKKSAPRVTPATDTLFDVEPSVEQPVAGTDAATPADVVSAVLDSELFARQFRRFGRRLDRDAVGTLLREAITGNGLLPIGRVGEILGVSSTRATAAMRVVMQVLNTDGVVVIELQGNEITVNEVLMAEQFGVSR